MEKDPKKLKVASVGGPGSEEARIKAELFQSACEGGRVEDVKSLLRSRADCYSGDSMGKTPLMCAAGRGHDAVVNVLIEYGAPWNALDLDGMTAGDHAGKVPSFSVVV